MAETRIIHCVNQGFIEELGEEEFTGLQQSLQNIESPLSPEDYLSRTSTYLINRFSAEEAEGMAFCIGRCAYRFIKGAFENELQFHQLDFRLLPPTRKTDEGIRRLIDAVFQPAGLQLDSIGQEDEEQWQLMPASALAINPARVLGGVLQEMLLDISGGKFYPIQITENDSLKTVLISIDAHPLGH